LLAGLADEADAALMEAGRIDDWDLPVFFVVPGLAAPARSPRRWTGSPTCG